MNFPNKQQFIDSVHKCLNLACDKYNTDVLRPEKVHIIFKPNGLSIGVAGKKAGVYYMKFSIEALTLNYEDMVKNTVPHEVAHLVCFEKPNLGKNHDSGWKRVCRSLGGDDSRTHNYSVSRAKEKTITRYVYHVNGMEIEFGPKHHAKIGKLPIHGCTFNYVRDRLSTVIKVFPTMYIGKREYRRDPDTGRWVSAQAVKNKIAQSAAAQSSKATGESKREACIRIFNANPTMARKDVIQLFVSNIGMTTAGAGTYYHNIKSGQWS